MTGRQLFKRIFYAGAALCPENAMLRVSEYSVASGKIPAAFDGFRVVQLSDLHGRSFGKNGCRLLEKIDAVRPDCIVITGDFADEHEQSFTQLFHLAEALCSRYPVYFVCGNHEQKLPTSLRRSFLRGLRARGVRILDNDSVCLSRGGKTIAFHGVRMPLRYYRYGGERHPPVFTEKNMERLAGPCESCYTVLLAHNPLFFETYAAWGADLTLCGHVHGGLFRLPRSGGLLSPERKFFPRYSAGVYRIGERCMEVSRGLGLYPRVNNLPEIVLLTLHQASQPEPGCKDRERDTLSGKKISKNTPGH